MTTHLYLLAFRTEALVASHLAPEQFGSYMAVGAQKRTFGHVLFFELDPTRGHDGLSPETLAARCPLHGDGSPRRSKYLSVYRAMESVPLEAYGKLYLTTRDGRVLGLEGSAIEPADNGATADTLHLYDELCPVTPRVVSRLAPPRFVEQLTSPDAAVRVPAIFFAEAKLDRDPDGTLSSHLPYTEVDRVHIQDCLKELANDPRKAAKTVDRNPPLDGFFNSVASGFYVGDATGTLFYPFPDAASLQGEHHLWWRSASLG